MIALMFFGLVPPRAAHSEDVQYASDMTIRLNPTGRTVTIPVPLKDHTTVLGDILIQITADDAILAEKAAILEKTATHVEPPVLDAIAQLKDQAGFVPIGDFATTGLAITFDSGLQELQMAVSASQRPTREISLGARRSNIKSADTVQPEFVAGYLNIIAGVDKFWDTGSVRGSVFDDQPSARLDLDSAIRVGDVVVENRASFDSEADAYICPETATCTYGHVAGFKRQTSRIVYDLPNQEVRVTLGDTDPAAIPLQRATDLLGVSIEKSARKLNPGEAISSRGSETFRIERNATVEVRVNGATVDHLDLRPGTYNLRDLPLTTGANDVQLAINDENGESKTLNFNAYSDPDLLSEGKSEWSLAAGAPSYLLDNQRTYATGDYMATGYYRYGIFDDLTGAIDLQADKDIVMGGAGFDKGTSLGLFGFHAAASTGSLGTGAAFDFNWSLANFSGLTNERSESLRLAAEYRSKDFQTPGDFLNGADGITLPEYNYWLRLNAAYSLPLIYDITATAAARYQFDDKDTGIYAANTVVGDRYGADLTFSTPLGPSAQANLSLGYSNELYLRNLEDQSNVDGEFRVALRFNIRPDDKTIISSGYDSLGEQATLSAHRSEGSGIGRWDTSIDAQSRGYQETGSVSASVGYYGNRADLRLSHYADVDNFDLTSVPESTTRQRTSARIGTSIAFAGNKVAIGAPVRGGAFAIVAPHESLADSTVTVGNPDSIRAQTDMFGNGLVTDIPAYVPSSAAIDVDKLPLGYSLGSGAFETFAPYKAGYVFEVGSAHSVTVYGRLEVGGGQPLALQSGTAHPSKGGGKTVPVFTNSDGKFGAEGLSPGRWILEMASDDGQLRYVIEVPDGAMGLVKVGTLTPATE